MLQAQRLALLLSLLFITPIILAGNLNEDIHKLQQDWAVANYQTDLSQTEAAFTKLSQQADSILSAYPNKAEPLIWKAIVLSSDAGKNGGLSALGKVKTARELLLKAEQINPAALNGSIYTSLGSLYYQVPGWPLGFGDDDEAQKYLQKALSINPQGIDPNYFYGDFLLEEGQYQEAISYFNKALKAKPRDTRPVADQGRRSEITKKLSLAKSP